MVCGYVVDGASYGTLAKLSVDMTHRLFALSGSRAFLSHSCRSVSLESRSAKSSQEFPQIPNDSRRHCKMILSVFHPSLSLFVGNEVQKQLFVSL